MSNVENHDEYERDEDLSAPAGLVAGVEAGRRFVYAAGLTTVGTAFALGAVELTRQALG